MSDTLLENLNPEQLEAVKQTNGPLLIIAGAGTGKTTVITKKIAHLIEKGLAKPDEILALTFTDKAAGEMEERVLRLLPYGYLDLWISTFHSFCERILRERGLEIGLPEFKLLSETEQWMLIRKNLDKFNLDYYRPMGNPTKFLHALLDHFSRAKDETVAPEEYLELAKNLQLNSDSAEIPIRNKISPGPPLQKGEGGEIFEDEKKKLQEVADAYHIYNQLLLESGALDFGDLINWTLKLFKKRPRILSEYRAKFKYILVDEFQDTNFAQYELIKLLAAPKNNLTVVADDDQSIYRWRGASMSNVLIFTNDFPEAKKVVLIKNYRSGQKILDTAYEFIKLNNPNRLEAVLGENLSKKLESQTEAIGEIELISAESLDDEVEAIFEKILKIKNQILPNPPFEKAGTGGIFQKENELISWNDFAILVRANDSARAFIRQADLLGVPYQFMASRGLYGKKIIIEVISYLKLLNDYHDSGAMFRFLHIPIWRLRPEDILDMNYYAKKKALSLYEAAQQIKTITNDAETAKKVEQAVNFLERTREEAKSKKPSQIFLKFFTDTGYLQYLTSLPDSVEKLNNFNYLKKFHKKIKDFEMNNDGALAKDFLELLNLELESGEAGALPASSDEGPEMIKILTIHAAKGLEFKYVFIANLVDKKFPTIERKEVILLPKELIKETLPEGDVHLEEERRLFYVAVTRAKEKLFLSWARDYGGVREKKASRFLYELGLLNSDLNLQIKSESANYPKQTISKAHTLADSNQFVNLNRKPYSLPDHFSYSQLKAFESCPCQYKLRFILNIPSSDTCQASFGRSIHNTLYKFLLKIKNARGASQTDLFGEKEKTAFSDLQELKELYEECWIDDWYETRTDLLKYKEKGWWALKLYYENLKNNPPSPLYLEQEFTMKFRDDALRGTIDRIDLRPDNKIILIDYKTGKGPKDGKLGFEDKEQLLVYYLACRDILGLEAEKLVLSFIIENKNYEFLPQKNDLLKIKNWVTQLIDKIKQLDFSALPDEHRCRWCDYHQICEFKK